VSEHDPVDPRGGVHEGGGAAAGFAQDPGSSRPASWRVGTRNEVQSRHLPSPNGRSLGPPGRTMPPAQGGRTDGGPAEPARPAGDPGGAYGMEPHSAERPAGASVAERPTIPSAREETIRFVSDPHLFSMICGEICEGLYEFLCNEGFLDLPADWRLAAPPSSRS